MIHSFGRRLSLFFDGTADAADDSEGGHPGAAVLHPMVDFVAYAEDCTLSGRIRLRAERLTDMLNDHEELELVDVMVQSLAEPGVVEVKEVVVPRDELLLVHATGPRGDLTPPDPHAARRPSRSRSGRTRSAATCTPRRSSMP